MQLFISQKPYSICLQYFNQDDVHLSYLPLAHMFETLIQVSLQRVISK